MTELIYALKILSILLAFPQFVSERDSETYTERMHRLWPLAQEVAKLPPDRAANVLAVGEHESRFARYVAEGCKVIPKGAANCDRDRRTGKPRALGYFQLWEVACHKAWALTGRAQLAATVECADKRLRHALYRCKGKHPKGSLAGMFAGYRSSDCTWDPKSMRERVRTREWVLRRLRQSGGQQ